MTRGRAGAIGLGLLGTALTSSLMTQGYEVIGHDPDPERQRDHQKRGGLTAASVAEVARSTDRILLCLPTSAVVESVCLGPGGIADAAASGTVVVDTTTSRPADSTATATELADRQIAFVDAAISGNSAMAAQRDITIMAGGEGQALQAVASILRDLGRSVHHMGPVGAGARTKLIVNMVLGVHRMVLAEALVFGERADLDPERLLAALKEGAAYSTAMDGWGDRMVSRDHLQPRSRIHQGAKDARLILDEAHSIGAPVALGTVVSRALQTAIANGWEDADQSALVEAVRTSGPVFTDATGETAT